MMKIFLFFWDFGRECLRVWPKNSVHRAADSVQKKRVSRYWVKSKEKLKNILKFLFLPFGYLRVWPKNSGEHIASSGQGRAKKVHKCTRRGSRQYLVACRWQKKSLDAGLRGTCLVFFFYIVINCFGSVLAAIAQRSFHLLLSPPLPPNIKISRRALTVGWKKVLCLLLHFLIRKFPSNKRNFTAVAGHSDDLVIRFEVFILVP